MGRQANIQYRMADARAENDGAGMSGYASHFWSVDSYGTALKRGAFRKTIRERGERIPVLWQHNPDTPIGKPTELKEDTTGLRFNAAISEGTTHGRDVMALLRDGVPLGMSFGFETIKDRAADDDDDLDFSTAPDFFKGKDGRKHVRIIEEVRLWEISAVTFPANTMATINDVRETAEADALISLIEHTRNGALTEAQVALIADLVAAFTERAEPEPSDDTPLPDDGARRRTRDADIALARHGRVGVQVWTRRK